MALHSEKNSIIFFLFVLFPTISFPQSLTQFLKPEEVNFSSVVGSGARAFGMGGAFIAVADDATAASWNPAGLAQLVKSEISIVYNLNNYKTDFPGYRIYPNYGIHRSGKNFNFLSFALPINTKQYKIVPQISYQRVIDFSIGDKLEGTYKFFKGDINYQYYQSGSFKGGLDIASLSIALKFSPLLSIATSFNLWFNGENSTYKMRLVEFGTAIHPNPKEEAANTRNEFKISGYNTNFGFLLNLHNDYKIGFVFKTLANLDFNENFKSFKEGSLDSSKSFTRTADLNLPYSIGFGISYRPIKKLTLSSDFTYSNWSEGKLKNIKKTFLDGSEDIALEEPFPGNKLSSTSREQNNTKQFRIGAEYIFLIDKFLIPLRSGFFTNTPYITDGKDRSIAYLGFTTGLGVAFSDLLLDAAFVYQNGSSFYNESANGNRRFKSYQFYVSAIYRLSFFK